MTTRTDLTHVASTSTRKSTSNGPVFRVTAYYVTREDFDLMSSGHPPAHAFAYRSINDGPRKAFRTRKTVPAFRKMMSSWTIERRAHTLGARQMEADQSY